MLTEKQIRLFSKAPWRQLQVTGRWKLVSYHDEEGLRLFIEAREMKYGQVHPENPSMWYSEASLRIVTELINTPTGE